MDLKRLFIRPDTEVSKPTVPTEGQGDQSADTAKQTTGGLRQKLAGAGSRLASILLKDEEKLGTSPAEAPAAPAAPRPESRGLRARIAGALFKNDAQVAQDAEAARAKKAEAGEYEFPDEDLREYAGFKVDEHVMVLIDGTPQPGWDIKTIRIEDGQVKFGVMDPWGHIRDVHCDDLVKVAKLNVEALFNATGDLITPAEVEALSGKAVLRFILYLAVSNSLEFAQRLFGIADLNSVSITQLEEIFDKVSKPYLPQNNDGKSIFGTFSTLLTVARHILLRKKSQTEKQTNEPGSEPV